MAEKKNEGTAPSIDLDTRIGVHKLTKACKVSPDDKSTESKTVYLEIEYNNPSIRELMIASQGQGTVVRWQNGAGGRKNYDKLVDKSTIKLSFAAPGAKDPEAEMVARLAAMTPDQQEAYLRSLISRAKK